MPINPSPVVALIESWRTMLTQLGVGVQVELMDEPHILEVWYMSGSLVDTNAQPLWMLFVSTLHILIHHWKMPN